MASMKTLMIADDDYLDKLTLQDKVALVTPLDESFSLDDIRIYNLRPALNGVLTDKDNIRIVNYDFSNLPPEQFNEEIAEGVVQNIRMLMAGQIDCLNLYNISTVDYCDMAGVDEIDVEGNEYLHWDDEDMQVLIDHFTLLGVQKEPGRKLN